MGDYHHQHVEAVGFAGLSVQEFENVLVQAKEKHAEAMAAVVNAVGDSPTGQHSRQAYEWLAGLADGVDEMIGVCENIKAELNAYGASIL